MLKSFIDFSSKISIKTHSLLYLNRKNNNSYNIDSGFIVFNEDDPTLKKHYRKYINNMPFSLRNKTFDVFIDKFNIIIKDCNEQIPLEKILSLALYNFTFALNDLLQFIIFSILLSYPIFYFFNKIDRFG